MLHRVCSEAFLVMVGKSITFKIPVFHESGPWVLYPKRFGAAAARNQWMDAEKTIAISAIEGSSAAGSCSPSTE